MCVFALPYKCEINNDVLSSSKTLLGDKVLGPVACFEWCRPYSSFTAEHVAYIPVSFVVYTTVFSPVLVLLRFFFVELFYTEKAHVRNLRVMQRIFYQPMREENVVPPEIVNLLFPNIDDVFEVHCELRPAFY